MKRGGYIVRKTPTRRKRARRIDRETPAEKYYKAWIHSQWCVCGCGNPVQQSHLRNMTGMGRKESNLQSIAMCADVHREWTEARGRFAGFSKLERFAYFVKEIGRAHALFKAQNGCRPEDWDPNRLAGVA